MNARKKKIYILCSLFLFVLLIGCDEQIRTKIDEEPIGDGYSLIRVSIPKDTKANGLYTVTEEPAFAQEKAIESVAFFTQCGDKGTSGQPGYKQGAFNKFFSTEELRSANGLYEPLDEINDGYTTSIRIKSDAFEGATKVIVIANYKSAGLTAQLMAVEQWEDLANIRTQSLTNSNLTTPLLMYGFDNNVDLSSGNTVSATFIMRRIVSRIDVVNLGYNESDASKGFVLETAQLITPREYSFLLPDNDSRDDIPTLASLPVMQANNSPAYDRDQIVGLYLYETGNDNDVIGKTAVKVTGSLFGTPFSRVVPLKQPDEPGVEGAPIPMLRNHLYRVIVKEFESDELEWDIEVVDWSDGQDLIVKPTPTAPVLSGFTTTNLSGTATWDETNRIFVYDGRHNEVITFTATGPQSTLYDFKCELDPRGMSLGLNNPNSESYKNFIKQSEAIITYTSVTEEYEITLPTVLNDHTVPVDIKVFIRNSANPHFVESFQIKCRPTYLDSPYKPVLIKGIYWAPLNVGATTTDVTIRNEASIGYYYQWGRNIPFSLDYVSENIAASAQVTYIEATTGQYKDKFITGGDWLMTNDPLYETRNKLWSETNDTPCPKGWRIPTKVEFDNIGTKVGAGTNRFKINGDIAGEELLIPYGGLKHYNDGNAPHNTGIVYLWISTNYNASQAYYFANDSGWRTNLTSRSHGMPIRCIQDTSYGLPKP